MKFITTYKLKLSMMILLLAIIGIAVSFAGSNLRAEMLGTQQSNTIRVSVDTGNNSENCGTEAEPCKTIQFAVKHRTNPDDKILVASGTYTYDPDNDPCTEKGYGTTGVICIETTQLTLEGGYLATDWSTPRDPVAHETIIDGQNERRGVLAIRAATANPDGQLSLTMDGFIIQNGRAGGIPARGGIDAIYAFGGGMFVDNAQTTNLNNIIFRNNRAVGEDSVVGSQFNFGGNGAGGGLALRDASTPGAVANLTNLLFENNEALGGNGPERAGFGIGGGIHTNAKVTGGDLIFRNNIARGGTSNGSGASPIPPSTYPERADALGAGAAFQDDSDIELDNIEFYNNIATGGTAANLAGGASGGGMFVEKAVAKFTNVILRDNEAIGSSAITGGVARGGGAEFINADVELTNVTVINNKAVGGNGTTGDTGIANGGGLSVTTVPDGRDQFTMTNAVIAGNSLTKGAGTVDRGGGGAGLAIQAVNAEVAHATIVDNRMNAGLLGLGVLAYGFPKPANVTLSDSIVANHSDASAAIYVHDNEGASTLTLVRGIWFNNSNNTGGAGTLGGSDTMLDLDPGFADAANFDYHLTESSGAIDQATGSAVLQDIEGSPRQGSADLGAYELSVGPTETPQPTATTQATETPQPTATMQATEAPQPTETTQPTEAPQPTEALQPNDDIPQATATPRAPTNLTLTDEPELSANIYLPLIIQ